MAGLRVRAGAVAVGVNGLDLPRGAVARAVKLARKELCSIYQKKAGLFRISFRRVLSEYLSLAAASPQQQSVAVVTGSTAQSMLSTRTLTGVMMQDATLRREISALWSELITERVRQYLERSANGGVGAGVGAGAGAGAGTDSGAGAGSDAFAFVDGLWSCYEQLHVITTLQLFPKARSVRRTIHSHDASYPLIAVGLCFSVWFLLSCGFVLC